MLTYRKVHENKMQRGPDTEGTRVNAYPLRARQKIYYCLLLGQGQCPLLVPISGFVWRTQEYNTKHTLTEWQEANPSLS